MTDQTTPEAPDLEKYRRRIEALLTKAEDPGVTPEEAQAFMAKAEELMVLYSIADAQANRGGKGRGKSEIGLLVVDFDAPAYLWRHLGIWGCGAVTEAIGLCGFAFNNYRRTFTLYGTAADTEHTAKVLRSVIRQALAGMALWKAEDPTYHRLRQESQSWATRAAQNYVYGFARGVGRRITEAKLALLVAEPSGSGAELVLVNRKAEISRAMEDLKDSRTRKPEPSLGFRAGVRDGRSALLRNEVG